MMKPVLKLGVSFCMAFVMVLACSSLMLAQEGAKPEALKGWSAPAFLLNPMAQHLPRYARVLTGNVPVYQAPVDLAAGPVEPVRFLAAGYVWVSLAGEQPRQEGWYAINPDEYVQAEYLELYTPSTFRGRSLANPSIFAWLVFDAWTAPAPGELPGEDSLLLERYTIVTIHETQAITDRLWYRVGGDHWLEQGMLGLVVPRPRPSGVGPTEKWIEIDLYEQTLAAYEGDEIVYATLVSSGLPWWQTETGLFRVWGKVKWGKMSGREGHTDYYFLEDVPWSLYFNRDFALHGAYWHDKFGQMHSHGCVNIAPADAKWLYEWAKPEGGANWSMASEEEPGTWVWVHDRLELSPSEAARLEAAVLQIPR